MKCFSVSYLLTTVAGLGAAFNGVAAAPTESARAGLALTGVENSPLPPALEQKLWQNYKACERRVQQNPRIFGGQPPQGVEAICMGSAGLSTGFQHALTAPPTDIPVVRASLHALAASRSENPLPWRDNAGHTARKLMRINAQDYVESQSASHLADQRAMVSLLKKHIAPDQRGSLEMANLAYQGCQEAVQGALYQGARKQVAERTELAILRSIGDPGSMDLEQLDDLRDDLMPQQFGNSPLKRRMVQEALQILVDEHRQALA